MRLFVAIVVGPDAPTERPAPPHLTLRFLGEVAPDRVAAVSEAVADAARESRPFDLVLEGVGAFPSPARPRVVWQGATSGGAETSALADRVGRALARGGFPAEAERFVPHVTLFRVRSPRLHRAARALLSGEVPPPPARTVPVREIALVESTRSPAGARHRTVATFPLGPTP